MTDDFVLPDDATRPAAPLVGRAEGMARLPGRHLKMIHDHHRQTLAALAEMLAAAEAGRIEPQEVRAAVEETAMARNLARFGTLCGQECQFIHIHHAIEDELMFPRLSAAATAFRAVIARLQEEHEVVHALLLRLIGDLEELAAEPGPDRLAPAAETFRTLVRFLLSHFDYEEASICDALGVYGIRI